MKSISDMPFMQDDGYEGPFASDPNVPKLAPSLVLGKGWFGRHKNVVEGKIVGHYDQDGKTLVEKPAHISADGWAFYLRQLDRGNAITPEEADAELTRRRVSDLNWDIRKIFRDEIKAEGKRRDWSEYVRTMDGLVVTDADRAAFADENRAYIASLPRRREVAERDRAAHERYELINDRVQTFIGVMILPVIVFGLVCGLVSFLTGSLTAFWMMLGAVAVLLIILFNGK